jgi:tetratricopeptide (TPR) repeat protein
LKLKPKDPDALEVRGTLRYWQWLSNLARNTDESKQLYAGAERDLRASVEANPNQASAWTTLSHLLINKPALGEAKLAALRAYHADPYLSNANVTLWRLFTTSWELEDAVEAKRWCEEGQRRFPRDYRFPECQLWLYEMRAIKPDIPHAWKLLERYVELSPASMRPFNSLMGQMRVAIVIGRAGLRDSARSVARRSQGDPNVDANRNLSELAAHVYAILGDNEEALKQLSVFLAANPEVMEGMAANESWHLRELRRDPRYAAVVGISK